MNTDEHGLSYLCLSVFICGLYLWPLSVAFIYGLYLWPLPWHHTGCVNSMIGRTSTLPIRADGIFDATWMASFRSRASIR